MDCSISHYITGQVRDNSGSSTKCFIITGAPSAGKTSIIDRIEGLKLEECVVLREAAGKIISKEKENGVAAPWDAIDFEERVVARQHKSLMKALANKTKRVFTDRSPVDAISYCLRMGHKLDKVKEAVQDVVDGGIYSKYVFYVEHLGVVENDGVRHEDLTECEVIDKKLREDYQALGFELILLEKATIEERTDTVLKFIKEHSL